MRLTILSSEERKKKSLKTYWTHFLPSIFVFTLNIRTDRPEQTVQTQLRQCRTQNRLVSKFRTNMVRN